MKIQSTFFVMLVQDMDRAVGFYRDVVGLELKSQSPYWTEFVFNSSLLVLHGGGAEDYRETGLVFQIDDIDAACREVEVGGGRVVIAPREGGGQGVMLANVADTEGNGFTFSQNS